MKDNEKTNVTVTDKGIALLAAIEAGLLPPQTEEGRDISGFEKFWEIYSEKSRASQEIKQLTDICCDVIKMLNNERQCRAKDRRDYLVSLVLTFLGMALGAVIAALLNL